MNKITKTLHIPSSELKSDIFDMIDSPEKAYVLGVLIADGHVHYGDSIRLTIGTSGYDSNVVNGILKLIGMTSGTFDADNHNSITICSKRLVMEIAKYGIVPHKHNGIMLPILENDMMPHLIRGIFDGDGFISDISRSMGICGSPKLISDICTYLTEHIGVRLVKPIVMKNSKSVRATWGSMSDVKRICNWMYNDKSSLYVECKYKKWIKILNYINYKPQRLPVRLIRVRQYGVDGVFIKEYENTVSASFETGISKESILQNCKKKSKTAGKYVFKFNEDAFSKYGIAKFKKK